MLEINASFRGEMLKEILEDFYHPDNNPLYT